MASDNSTKCSVLLDQLPTWKKELILRKRANTRVHGDLSIISVAYLDTTVVATSKYNSLHSADNPEQQSARGHQLSSCSVRAPVNPASVEKIPILQSQLEYSQGSEGYERVAGDSDSIDSVVRTADNKNNVDNIVTSTDIKTADMHHKGLNNRPSSRSSRKVLSNDCEQEEFQYGPGIVSRLKDRYLSLAMREAKCRASLRKYSSLEDLLDDQPYQQRGRSTNKSKPAFGPQPSRKELMKRTRSVDSLSFRKSYESNMPKSVSSGAIKNPPTAVIFPIGVQPNATEHKEIKINNEDINKLALCRNSSSSSSTMDEDELPQHDTVRQTKQIFESGTSGPRVARGTASKVATYKANQALKKPVKPAIKAKPPQLMARKAPLTPALENIRVAMKQVPPVSKPTPRPALSARAAPGVNENVSPSHKKGISPGLTPVTASVTAPLVNGDYKLNEQSENVYQKAPSSPISSLRKDSPDIDITDRAISNFNPKGRPLSPIPANLPPSPPSSHKITPSNMIDSDSENLKEIERVKHENKKNMEQHLPPVPPPKSNEVLVSLLSTKSAGQKTNESAKQLSVSYNNSSRDSSDFIIPDPVIVQAEEMPVNGSSHPSSAPSMKPKTRIREAQNNSIMFDFTKRNDTPNHIENDGLDMSKRKTMQYNENAGYVIMPGYEGRQDSSTDDLEDDPLDARPGVSPSPCNVHFEGAGVIINGRSNLQRQPRSKKLDISFDMTTTSVYEYPSESFVLVEYESTEVEDSSPILQGGLACYTPSKLQLSDSFRLGVSKSLVMHPPTPPKERPQEDISILDHLRPADESEIIAWSSDNAPDLLF